MKPLPPYFPHPQQGHESKYIWLHVSSLMSNNVQQTWFDFMTKAIMAMETRLILENYVCEYCLYPVKVSKILPEKTGVHVCIK